MHDLIIVGAGPGGYTAAIYARRFMLDTLLIGKIRGGELSNAHLLENWPGEKSINGYDLTEKMRAQAAALGTKMKEETVTAVTKGANRFIVECESGKEEAKAVIVATGTERRKLGAPGEKEFLGRGVSYCAICDAPLFKNKTVGVVGGSDAAATEALMLAEHAKKVYILYRKEEIRAEPVTKERIKANKKIEVINNVNVTEIKGGKLVKSVVLDNGKELALDGVFIEIGGAPASVMLKSLGVETNQAGEIVTNKKSETNVAGVFAAGDVTDSPYKQAITASAQGAVAAVQAFTFIKKGGK
jgi:thioredoxin reductase (NADPH)